MRRVLPCSDRMYIPKVSMHTPSVADYVRHLQSGDWAGIGTLMLASALEVQAAGADFLICPDNTIHAALPLIGTRWLVESEVYQQKLQARASLCAVCTLPSATKSTAS